MNTTTELYATDGIIAGKVVHDKHNILKVINESGSEYFIYSLTARYLSTKEYSAFIPDTQSSPDTIIANDKFDIKLKDKPTPMLPGMKRKYTRKTFSVKTQAEKIVNDFYSEGKKAVIDRIKRLGVKESVASVYYYTFKPRRKQLFMT